MYSPVILVYDKGSYLEVGLDVYVRDLPPKESQILNIVLNPWIDYVMYRMYLRREMMNRSIICTYAEWSVM